MTTRFKVFADSLFVERDQRTRFVNFEGKLELQGKFSANGNPLIIFPAGAAGNPRMNVQVNQGETISLNLELADVSFEGDNYSLPIRADLLELEFGGAGNDDSGSASGEMVLNSQSEIRKSLMVDISADASTERGARVRVDFVARRQ